MNAYELLFRDEFSDLGELVPVEAISAADELHSDPLELLLKLEERAERTGESFEELVQMCVTAYRYTH